MPLEKVKLSLLAHERQEMWDAVNDYMEEENGTVKDLSDAVVEALEVFICKIINESFEMGVSYSKRTRSGVEDF